MKKSDRKCTAPDCGRRHYARDLCFMHYKRLITGRDMAAPPRVYGVKVCQADGCERSTVARGLCVTHYQRLKDGRPLDAPLKKTDGSGYTCPKGYVWLSVDGEKISAHRHAMQTQLGRKLRDDESVHHINGIRNDNRPENLELWSRYQPAGQRIEDKLAWAHEILRRYAA